MISDLEVEDFLAHHGVKGQHWGIRKQQLDRIGRVAAGTAKRAAIVTGRATGRGIKKTAIFVHDHPKFVGSVAVGAAFVALHLRGIKKTAIFIHNHPRGISSVALGATFVAVRLNIKKHNNSRNKRV